MAIGSKGLGFLTRIGAKVVSQAVQIGDRPQLDKLVGPVKVVLDAYAAGKLKAVYLCYTRFINTMRQEPVIEQLLPLTDAQMSMEEGKHGWDYIYEPEAKVVIDELLIRYVEALVYHATAENVASEQAARMVAMKSATDNAGNVIAELAPDLQQDAPGRDHQRTFRDRRRCGGGLTTNRSIQGIEHG